MLSNHARSTETSATCPYLGNTAIAYADTHEDMGFAVTRARTTPIVLAASAKPDLPAISRLVPQGHDVLPCTAPQHAHVSQLTGIPGVLRHAEIA